MPNVNPLDRVIRMVDSNDKPSKPNENRIIIDASKAEILQKDPMFSWGKPLRYYIVSNQNNIECEGLECKIRDVSTKNSVNVLIDYDISCPIGSEEKVVRALYNGDNPKIVLDEYINRWIKEFNHSKRSDGINLVTSFFNEKSSLQEFITGKAKTEVGVDLHPYISLEGEEQLEVINIKSDNFPIWVKDFDSKIFLKYEAKLDVLQNKYKINAILDNNHLSKIEKIIKNEIEKFLIQECNLHQFCYELEDKIKPVIEEKINLKLKDGGRKISYIKFDPQISDLVAVVDPPMITQNTNCKIKDSQKDIEVINRVLMKLDNLGKFRKSKIESLEEWLKSKLKKVVQEVFFERDRIDLLRNLKNDEDLIQDYLQSEAEKIGYSVKHLAFLPDLEELSLKQGFKVANKSSYRTKDNRINIRLEVIINAKIEDFNGIEEHLKDGVKKFKKKIKETSKSIIEPVIREHNPSDIYASAFKGENSIENQLKSKLKESLEDSFRLVETKVSLLFLDTDLTKRIYGLQAAFPVFQVDVTPLRTSLIVPYKVSYIIKGVHQYGFATFQANAFKPEKTEEEVDKINEKMADEVKRLMDTVPVEVVRYGNIETLEEIRKIIIDPALKSIAQNSFGLIISEIKIRRLQTNQEIAATKKSKKFLKLGVRTEVEIAEERKEATLSRLKELNKLEKQHLNVGDKKELKKVRKQIKELTQQSSNYMDDYNEQQKQIGKGDNNNNTDDNFSFDAYLSEENTKDKEEDKL